MSPSAPYVIPTKLNNAVAKNDNSANIVMIFLDTNDICLYYNVLALRRSELPTTETLENAIASPAKTGDRSQPKNG